MDFEKMARTRGPIEKPKSTPQQYQEDRLHKTLPGGTLHENIAAPTTERWEVLSGKKQKKLSHGATAAEAVDRACWLFGRNDR